MFIGKDVEGSPLTLGSTLYDRTEVPRLFHPQPLPSSVRDCGPATKVGHLPPLRTGYSGRVRTWSDPEIRTLCVRGPSRSGSLGTGQHRDPSEGNASPDLLPYRTSTPKRSSVTSTVRRAPPHPNPDYLLFRVQDSSTRVDPFPIDFGVLYVP